MTDKIVEAVARLIDPDAFILPQIDLYRNSRRRAVEKAKAAIAAVLDAIAEPSEAMREIGHNAFWSVGGGWLSAHRAMIAALRKEIEDQS